MPDPRLAAYLLQTAGERGDLGVTPADPASARSLMTVLAAQCAAAGQP